MSSNFTNFNQVEPVLDIHNIQGNILVGFNKDHQTLLGFLIGDSNTAKGWIKLISDRISTLYEVYHFDKIFKSQRSRQKHEPINVKATWVNIAFSYNGMKKLVQDIDKIDEQLNKIEGEDNIEEEKEKKYLEEGWNTFKDGLAKRSSILGDPIDESSIGNSKNWCIGREEVGDHTIPDILLIVASDSPTDLVKEVDEILKTAAQKKLTVIYNETGHDLSFYSEERKGKEHFGFKDGISQPAIRGRISDDPKDYLTPRSDLTSEVNPFDIEYTYRGRPLVAPGEFVLGYPTQNELYPRMVNPSKFVPELLKNGSYLVFRRLRQDVDGFENFINQTTMQLQLRQEFADLNSEKLKAILVGRWPSGAPLALSPKKDDLTLAKDSDKNNQFGYSDDVNGYKTPTFSHIRKVNPRDLEGTDINGPAKNLKKKILRRGIPFGIPRDFVNSNDNLLNCNNDRGLLFLSYQSSIKEQFEFLTTEWMNNDKKPTNPAIPDSTGNEGGGHDLITGQIMETADNPNRIRYVTLLRKVDNKIVKEVINTDGNGIFDWVIPTGGGYFFAPSISTLTYIGEN